MAFDKYARAVVVRNLKGWEDWRKISPDTFNLRTSNEVVAKYDSKKYLLTHCTIIASVDVEDFKSHYITPETTKFVNNNFDAWERSLLLKTFKTFVGADNFVEHIQLADQSKGKVIDAVAREVVFPAKTASEREAKSVYVDILVATDRKHKDLIKDIEEGTTNKLSMGCVVAFTICSRCGKKAYDAVQLCPHIRYEKGNKFIDEKGVERIIAELCGHKDDSESVKFIDASWVKNPAFTGAVTRNIVIPDDSMNQKIKSAFEIEPLIGTEGLQLKKVAGTNSYTLSAELLKVAQGEDELTPEEKEVEKEVAPPTEEKAPEGDEEVPKEESPKEEAPESEADLGDEEAPKEVATPEEITTPEEIKKDFTFLDVKENIKNEIKKVVRQEAGKELLDELKQELEKKEVTRLIPDEHHLHETLVHSYDSLRSLNSSESILNAKRRKVLSFLATKSSEQIQAKLKLTISQAHLIKKALQELNKGKSWISLKDHKISGSQAIVLSALIDSLVQPGYYDKRLYQAVLKPINFKNKEGFKRFYHSLFKRNLTREEVMKIAEMVKIRISLEK